MYKALTLFQPFASGVVENIKRYETRSWPTKYRGRVYIHAGKKYNKRAVDIFRQEPMFDIYLRYVIKEEMRYKNLTPREWRMVHVDPLQYHYKRLPHSVILGYCDLTDCLSTEDFLNSRNIDADTKDREGVVGDLGPGRYVFKFENITKLNEPVHVAKGALGLWNVDKFLFGRIMESALMYGIQSH